ncbi:MAG: YggU family protein [Candidatus Bathyarchaeum sp.]|nr:MAG: YggU family protein [Candidatus Bathyarchaeum sp.]
MRLLKTAEGVVLEVYVKPNSKIFRVELEDDELVVSCCEAPVKGRVNRELVKVLSRLFNRRVELVSGFSSRHKRILIINIEADEVNRILASISTPDTP